MRFMAGVLLLAAAFGVAGIMPAAAKTPSYALTKRCTDASGFTRRAVNDPAYRTGKVYANARELAYINHCVAAATGTKSSLRQMRTGSGGVDATPVPAMRGNLPVPSQYPLMREDAALWVNLTMAQQRRAMLFLQTGSTIRSSLFGD